MDFSTLLPVLLGSDQNAYGMARSFHLAYGVKSACIARHPLPATMDSAIVKYALLVPSLEEDDVFVQTLTEYAKKTPGKTRILVPCSDAYARLCARHAPALAPDYKFALPEEKTLVTLASKESFYQTCETFSLSHPRSFLCDPRAPQSPPFGFPMVLKPADSAAYWNCSFDGKRKVFFLKTQDELQDVLRRLSESDYEEQVILQEFIPGDDSAMRVINAYLGSDGQLRLFCVGRVLLEEHTPEGIGSYAAILSSAPQELYDTLSPMLKSLSYRGFLNIDAKLDRRTGTYQFFELNPRQGRSSFFVTCAGANLAKVLTEDVLGLPASTPLFPEEKALWTNIPKRLILRYVSDPALKKEVRRLCHEKRFYEQLDYEADSSLKRREYYYLNQLNQCKKYRKYFLDKNSLSK